MAATTLPHDWEQELNHFKRQYLQLQVSLKYPERQYLKHEDFQQALCAHIFSQDALLHFPPQRYQLRVLKELMKRIEDSITDWEEEVRNLIFHPYLRLTYICSTIVSLSHITFLAHCLPHFILQALTNVIKQQTISDDLMECLSSLLTTRMPAEMEAAQAKSYVTYSLAALSSAEPPTITISESRNLLGGTGTTGFRTWEACLQLVDFLCSEFCPLDLKKTSQTILELGCGTGYLSIQVAKHFSPSHITATDGFDTVVDDLPNNFVLNGLEPSPSLRTQLLKWGEGQLEEFRREPTFLEGKAPDLILGADVTYDAAALPVLCETLTDLLTAYPKTQILIASTVRNEETFQKFLNLCEEHDFMREELKWTPKALDEQTGPFYRVDMPVRLSRITAKA